MPEPVKQVIGEDKLKNASIRRTQVVKRWTEAPHIVDNPEEQKEVAPIAMNIPIDTGEAYARFHRMGLPVKYEAKEITENPENFQVFTVQLPKMLYNKWMAYLANKKIYTPMTFLIQAIEKMMAENP